MINMSGDAQLGQLSYARIVRIAIVPELHHQGLGHLLLSFIEGDLRQSQVAVIGTSFGAHAALLAFWQSANYRTIKLGSKRDHVSGEHSALMVKSLNTLGASSVANLNQSWCQDIPLLLSHCFNDIAPKLTLQLLKEAQTRPLTEADRLCLTRFVNNEIPLNLCYGALYRAIAGNWSLLFNVDDEESLSKLAGLPMVNGGFQFDCPQALLSKGIKAIFDGELWFPRAVLQTYLMKSRTFNKTFSRSEVNLTDREVEVLKVMATGAKNSEIASSLNLSPHTIKTHIYNIFKKINASNRLQAVNWAQENL